MSAASYPRAPPPLMNSRAPSPSLSPQPETSAAADCSTASPSSNTDADGCNALPSSASVVEAEGATEAIDMLRHPKGKRKRTAAKDKAVLEAAYNANPKPDKAARLEIVNRVSLNEKEVQIWFQNRRQNDRRKSRPLSPQEVAALRYGGMQILSSDPAPCSVYCTSGDAADDSTVLVSSQQEPGAPSSVLYDGAASGSSDEGEKPLEKPIELPGRESVPPRDEGKAAVEAEMSVQKPASSEGPGYSQSFSSSIGYLSNRWNPGSSFSTVSTSTPARPAGDDSFKLESFSSSFSSSQPAPILPPPSPSQSSQFRLSLSLEGKAEVVSSNPSPPRIIAPRPSASSLKALGQIRRPSLHRSQSASSLITLPPISTLTKSLTGTGLAALPPRLTRGRSRDVHAWELCCDAENREDALIAQAKHESTGSAIAAISLLRSSSGSSSSVGPLQPSNSAKRNAGASRAKSRDGLAKKQKLSRALSSVAWLQTEPSSLGETKPASEVASDAKKVKVSMLISPSGNDSDKENWSPDEEGNPRFSHHRQSSHQHSPLRNTSVAGRRPLPSAAAARPGQTNMRRSLGRILQEDDRHPFSLVDSNRANTAPLLGRHQRPGKKKQQRGPSPLEIFEDDSEEDNENDNDAGPALVVDDDVERFMRGEVSPSKRGDVDAVAGLLSLSQGNWR